MTAYSVIGIVNMALGRIGQTKISSLTEGSTAADQSDLVWPYIRDEVLAVEDWTFAKTRVALAQNATTPVQGFNFAYNLPDDFIRIVLENPLDPSVYPNGLTTTSYMSGEFYIQGVSYNYVIETLEDETLCLFTDYDNSSVDLVIQYIRRIENPARYSPLFINALAYRLAAEVSIILTESVNKFETMMTMYRNTLYGAKSLNRSGNYVANETGNTDWDRAGR